MIRSLPYKTLAFRGMSWMFRVDVTSVRTVVSKPVYVDSYVRISIHNSVSGVLIGYEVSLRYLPDVPMVYDEHAVIIPFQAKTIHQVHVLFADNNFRVLGCGSYATGRMNYLIVPKYGVVEPVNTWLIRGINSIIQEVKRG